MKKILLSAAVLAAFASCSKTEVTEVVATSDAISFSTLNDRVVSKSANETSSSYKVYSSYYGSATASDWYFSDDVTDGDVTSSIHYWPTDGSALNFYAYAPNTSENYGEINATVTTGIDAISIFYTVAEAATEDFTVAAAVTNQTGSDGTVDLSFSHMLSKVEFKVVLSENLTDAGYVLVDDYTVDFGVAESNGAMNVLTGDWTDGNATAEVHMGGQVYNIYPQTSTTSTITIKGLNINKTTSEGTEEYLTNTTLYPYTIVETNITDDKFAKGTYYTITFTVDGSSLDEDGDPIVDPTNPELVILFTSSYSAAWEATGASSLDAVSVNLVSLDIAAQTLEEETIGDAAVTAEAFTYYTAGYYILTSAGDELTTGVDYAALVAYMGTAPIAKSDAEVEGTYAAEAEAVVLITQEVTSTVYSVNGSNYAVIEFGAVTATGTTSTSLDI